MSVSGEERGRKELGEFGEPATARFGWWEAGNARLRALGILQAVGSHRWVLSNVEGRVQFRKLSAARQMMDLGGSGQCRDRPVN